MLHHAPTLLYHNYNLAWPWCPSSQLLSMLSRLQRHYYSTTTAQRHQHCSSTPEGGLQNLQHASYWIIIILVCALQYYLGHLCTFMKAHHIYASHTGFLSRLLCSLFSVHLWSLRIRNMQYHTAPVAAALWVQNNMHFETCYSSYGTQEEAPTSC